MKIIKRDGKTDSFNKSKIYNAILKAQQALPQSEVIMSIDEINLLTDKITYSIKNNMTVDEIQKIVEINLMESNFKNVAREYIQYRTSRDNERRKYQEITKNIKGLIELTDKETLENNANKDSTVIPVQRDLLAGIVCKDWGLNYLIPKEVVKNHNEGYIYFHDLDYSPFFPMYNCMLIDIRTMLEKGFQLGNATIEEPKSISVACAVVAQIIAQVSSHIYGGNTINGIDTILEKYVNKSFVKHFKTGLKFLYDLELDTDFTTYYDDLQSKDKYPKAWEYAKSLTEKETFDAFQSLEYEINTLFSANGQTPFSTLGFGLGTSWESRLIQSSILNNRIRGLGAEGKTPVFPKLVFVLKEGLNLKPTDPNYDIKELALECSVKRLYPDILMYDKIVEFTGSFKYPMGCRSFLSKYTDENGDDLIDGRFNMGVITINLPKIAIEAKRNNVDFYKLLEEKLEVCEAGLLYRIERLKGVKAKVAPILYLNGATGAYLNKEDTIDKLLENGRSSISLGYIGLHETIKHLYGKNLFGNDDMIKEATKILEVLNKNVSEWKEKYKYGFSVYGTPSESLCYKFKQILKDQYGVIDGITDKNWITNSFHLDVTQECNAFEKIDFESNFQKLSSGGFITYIETNSMVNNPKALEALWDYAYNKIGYFAINTPSDMCFKCNYKGEFIATESGFKCPNCNNSDQESCSCIRRVSGYLTEPSHRPLNKGKHSEIANRYKHY